MSVPTDAPRREPWPWLVGGLLGVMIAISLGFFAIAVANPDPDVRQLSTTRPQLERGEAPQ